MGKLQSLRAFWRIRSLLGAIILILSNAGWTPSARAALQFDVFFGFDGVVREGNWFPVACEVHNDGPPFNAVFEFSREGAVGGQVRRVNLELPTNTRKRFVIPAFASGRFQSWTARLLDDRGKVHGENQIRPTKPELNSEAMLIGSVSRSFGGIPTLPPLAQKRQELQPTAARLDVNHFPDNPVAIEALSVIYLNSEKAIELKDPQIKALIAWINLGGHLILAVEQPNDVNATPWLKNLLPCDVTGVANTRWPNELVPWLQDWLGAPRTAGAREITPPPTTQNRRNVPGQRPRSSPSAADVPELKPPTGSENAEMPMALCSGRDGQVIFGSADRPLILQGKRGRGKVTVLAFSPEREPFRTWDERSWLWARLCNIQPGLFKFSDQNYFNRYSVDGVFGAMLDSRQVRKLPVGWLLLLLVVYLVVVGPLDQYWLKRINRQMLTWITFPTYVVCFSVFIYWIGFKLRAGENEWNELHVVDVLPTPNSDRAQLRGQMFASIYSPANARYELGSDQTYNFATLRSEYAGSMGAAQDSGRSLVEQRGDGFRAEVFVPIWVNQLYVSDWWRNLAQPVSARISRAGESLELTVTNNLPRKLTEVRLVFNNKVYALGELPSQSPRTITLESKDATSLLEFVRQNAGGFAGAVEGRRRAFGNEGSGRLANSAVYPMAATFASRFEGGGEYGFNARIMTGERFELSPLLERGDAVLLAWDADNSIANPLIKFKPKRVHRDTLFRLGVPVP